MLVLGGEVVVLRLFRFGGRSEIWDSCPRRSVYVEIEKTVSGGVPGGDGSPGQSRSWYRGVEPRVRAFASRGFAICWDLGREGVLV